MLNTILGSKVKMGQTFIGDTRIAVTYIKAGPCVVTHVKTDEKDGYQAVQLGFAQKRIKNVTKPLLGHFKGAVKDNKAPRFLREVEAKSADEVKVGDEVLVGDIFKKGDVVQVSGKTKGKGFAGVVKRWNFGGGPKTHGQSDRHRAPGSIGQGTTPGRVHKGKKMAGRMGHVTSTVKNLVVVDIDKENNLLTLSGPVPGIKDNLLIIKKLKAGSLEDLIEETPEVQVQVEEEVESEEGKENKETGAGSEKTEVKEETNEN